MFISSYVKIFYFYLSAILYFVVKYFQAGLAFKDSK